MTEQDDTLAQILAAGLVPVEQLAGLHCCIELRARPAYCNRGNWIAGIAWFAPLSIDAADGWPRYYFDRARAKAEIEAWLDKRGERMDGLNWQETSAR